MTVMTVMTVMTARCYYGPGGAPLYTRRCHRR